MALIILALGGLLTLAGVYAMAIGFPVIEIERGWSMVISGAVFISGGLIVASLGLVVRSLGRLQFNALPEAASATTDRETAPPATFAAEPTASPAPREITPPSAVAAPVAVLAAGGGAAAAAALHAQEPDPEPSAFSEAMPETSAPPAQAEITAPARPQEPDRVPEPTALAEEPTAYDPLSHDWLDKEFAAFDLDAPQHAPPEPGPQISAPEPAAHEPVGHEPSSHDAADHPSIRPEDEGAEPAAPEAEPIVEHAPEPPTEAPATAPDVPPSNLTVIGRYDSEGTSYVMYSDGSIEAASEAGVFRFGSMAELKAFIEG